jgi:hypothetical protein
VEGGDVEGGTREKRQKLRFDKRTSKSFSWEDVMKSNTRRFITIVAIGSGLMLPLNTAIAQTPDQTAEWVEWALSIPTSVNPQTDTTGGNCMVGQRGSIWFLAGVFLGGTGTRTCSVPADKVLFFPVADSFNINTPKVCGQGPKNLTVAQLRAASAAFIDGVTSKSVKVDGQPVANIPRISSKVFEVALPENNVFDAPCIAAGLGNVPAGIYSPAVDDGFYVVLGPFQAGKHTVRFSAQNPSQNFVEDVTYNLTVVPVTLQ